MGWADSSEDDVGIGKLWITHFGQRGCFVSVAGAVVSFLSGLKQNYGEALPGVTLSRSWSNLVRGWCPVRSRPAHLAVGTWPLDVTGALFAFLVYYVTTLYISSSQSVVIKNKYTYIGSIGSKYFLLMGYLIKNIWRLASLNLAEK